MEINRKKIYLSIILALFILFSLLFIPCCNVFATSEQESFANYGKDEDWYNETISNGYSIYFIQPGGTLTINNSKGVPDSNGVQGTISIIGHKDESPYATYTHSYYDNDIDEIVVQDDKKLYPLGSSTRTFIETVDWRRYEFHDNNYPVLVVVSGGSYNSEESSGITFTYFPPSLEITLDMTKSSKEPNVPGSIIGNLIGTNLESGGRLRLGLSKRVGNKYSFVANLIDKDIVEDSFNFEFSCPALELGQYVLSASYETDSEELTDLLAFNIDGTINDVPRDINVGGNTYRTDSYFRKVWHIVYPRNKYFYDELNPERFIFTGDIKYFDRDVNGKFSYNDNFNLDPVAQDLKANVFINDYLLTTFDISSSTDWIFSLSPSLLNRGRNSAYITSFSFRDEPDEIYSYKIGDKYYYLFDAIDFYYKTTEGYESDDIVFPTPDEGGLSGGRLIGGREGDPWGIPGPGGSPGGTASSIIGQPPNRSDYPDDILGTLNYGLAYLGWIISIPFNILVSAFDWLVNVITSMFYWVGQLSSLIGSWFNFLPIEVRSLLMAAFVCSIVAFVFRLFRK